MVQCPVVKVEAVSADVEHVVDGGSAAEDLPPGPGHSSVHQAEAGVLLGRGAELPVDGRLLEHEDRLGVVGDDVLRAARLEEQDLVVGVFGEAVGEDATGGPRPHDDVVVGLVNGKKFFIKFIDF